MMKTASINEILSIMGKGLDLRSDELIDEKTKKKIKEIAKILNVKEVLWEPLYNTVARELYNYLEKHGEPIYTYTVENPAIHGVSYTIRVFKIGDKYIVAYAYGDQIYDYYKFDVTKSLKQAYKKVKEDLESIIDFLDTTISAVNQEDLRDILENKIAEVKEEIKRLKKH